MGTLLLLMLAADPMPPPPPEEPAWDLGAQVSISALQSLNGLYLGIAACGSSVCYADSAMPVLFGAVGAGAGLALSLIDREPARGWGRAAFLDSAILGAGLLSLLLGTQLNMGPQLGYSVIFLVDAGLTAAALVVARRISPPPDTVWLADSLGLWGAVIGSTVAALFRSNLGPDMIVGAAAGVAAGALMGLSAQRMSLMRVLIANAGALVGALVLGVGLSVYASATATPARPYDPLLPTAGAAAGIAGGFLTGFALSESL